MPRIAIAAIAFVAAPVLAETVDFEADEGVVFARCAPHFVAEQMTVCEALFPQGTEPGEYSCVLLIDAGQIIASGAGPDDYFNGVAFNELDPSLVADMKCRKR